MNVSGKVITRNTSFLTGAYIFQKIFAFIYFTLIARWLGAGDIGQYEFAIAVTSFLGVFIDLGLANVLVREIAKYKEKAHDYLNTVVTAKIILSVIVFAIAVVFVNILDKSSMVKTMVYIVGGVMILDSFSVSFWSVFRGGQNLSYESISIAINQLIIVVVGLGGVLIGFPLYILAVALLMGSAFNFIFSLVLLRLKLHILPRFKWDWCIAKPLFLIAIPFALAAIFARGYTYLDRIILSVLIGDVQLGWYSPAYKLTFVFQCIPAAFGAALYPAMSRLFLNEKERLVGIFEKSLHFLMVIAVPISIGIGVLAHSIVTLVYTSTFEPSVISLQILIGAVIVIFMGFPVGALLNACDKQMVNTVNMGISMVVNIILNVILIPRYQHVGASIAALSTLTLLLILNFSWVSKVIRFRFGFFFKRASITLFSGAVMGAVVYWVKDDINIVFSVALGAIVYVGMMYALRGFTKSDIQFFIQAVIKRT